MHEHSTFTATRSVPGAPDLNGEEQRASEAGFIDAESHVAGFVDLPGFDADAVTAALLESFRRLDGDAVLTAYCTEVDVEVMGRLCEQHGMELVHSVAQEAGTTFVLKQSSGKCGLGELGPVHPGV